MYRILSIGLELFAAAIVLVPLLLVLQKVYFHNGKRTILLLLFSCYLAAMYIVVGLPSITYFRFDVSLNWIPFWGMMADIQNSILNVILFVPFGFFLPLLWKRFRSFKATVLLGLGTTLFIETVQIFTFRATDINDIITNMAGTIIGYWLTTLLTKKISSLLSLASEKRDTVLVFSTVLLSCFLRIPLFPLYFGN